MKASTHQHETSRVCVFEHLTGPSRGQITVLGSPDLYAAVGPDRFLRIGNDPDVGEGLDLAAHLWLEDGAYVLARAGDQSIWINGRKVEQAALRQGDVVEFGELGPISRYRSLGGAHPIRHSLDEMLGDSLAYLRASRKPIGRRVGWATGNFLRRLLRETTLAFRVLVLAALVGLGYFVIQQGETNRALQESLDRETAQRTIAMARARQEALRPTDLNALRDELGQRLSSNVERLQLLEEKSGASSRVIATSAPSVVFLQASYGLRHIESGGMLRHVLGPDGIPMMSPTGRPLLSVTAAGPVVEVQATGTGFLLDTPRVLVTNRHVAQPWETNSDAETMAAQGMEPVMLRFIGYFPGQAEAVEVELAAVSDTADLAILTADGIPQGLGGLPLAEDEPARGDAVIVMGYPTGLRSMLAQSGANFVKMLQEKQDTDFWSVARRLAGANMIAPLSSRGIVGQIGIETVIYDAETTHGGSGGPVLNAKGEVVAVNAAILPEFGGSNIGVPARKLKRLLGSMAAN